MASAEPVSHPDKETARIEAFSDGVFAIAITLLILEIKVPMPAGGPLGEQLLRQWPSYISFVISFWFIGVMWVNHHRMFTLIKRSDTLLLIFNLLLLFGVTVVPFPTAVLAMHLGQPDQRAAVMLYNGTYIFIAIAFNLLWRYAVSKKGHFLGADVDLSSAEKISRQYGLGPVAYILSFVLGFYSVRASLGLDFALAIFFALPPHIAVRHHRD
jgi:uncharacterized membrane protein